jgi:hypothetical protein
MTLRTTFASPRRPARTRFVGSTGFATGRQISKSKKSGDIRKCRVNQGPTTAIP